MTSYQIKIIDIPVCKRTLAWLRDHSVINRNGLFQVEDSIDGMAASQIIRGIVAFSPAISEGTKIRLLRHTLTRWREAEEFYNSDNLIGTFKQVIEIELQNLENNKSSFVILSFLNVEQQKANSLSTLTIFENELHFPSWSGLDYLALDDFWKEMEDYFGHNKNMPLLKKVVTHEGNVHYLKQKQNFSPIITKIEAIDAHTALSIALDSLELLRAVFNLPVSLSLFRQYGTHSMTLSRYLPSPIYGVFHQGGEFDTLFYTPEIHQYRYRRQRMSIESLEFCIDLLNDLNGALPGSLKYLIVKAIKLYQQAFDFTEYQATYLGLWQLLEVLTLNEPGQGRTQVDKRIACLLGLRGEDIVRDAIRFLMESRNTLVHSGIFPEYADELVFTLKGIVDEVLWQIRDLSNDLSTESELREYYRLVSKSNADLVSEAANLDDTKKVIEFIQNSRNQT